MKFGATLVELVVCLTILGVVLATILIAIQASRESSRQLACLRNLQQAASGVIQLATSHSIFPAGTNSYSECLDWDDFRNSEHGAFWKKRSQASFLVMILPFVEENDLYHKVDRSFVLRGMDLPVRANGNRPSAFFVHISGFWDLSSNIPSMYRCPNDGLGVGVDATYVAGSQPVTKGTPSSDFFSHHTPFEIPNAKASILSSSYLGCAGPHSGGIHPDSVRDKYRGVMSSGERVRNAQIVDGLSNTILIGETLGEVSDSKRSALQLWSVGGLARGRGEWPWFVDPARGSLLGSSSRSSLAGFASSHSLTVNFAFSDGSTRKLSRDIEIRAFYSLSGRSDGGVFDVF